MGKQSRSHRLEQESKRHFEAAISPWIVNWTIRDYATDGLIDICHSIDGEYDDLINLKFCVQLKASAVLKYLKSKNPVFSFESKDIVFWCRGNMPYLLVLFDSQTKKCFYRWADSDLINDLNKNHPTWKMQKSVAVEFRKENQVNSAILAEIEQYVHSFKKADRAILIPGTYFNFKERILKLLGKAKEYFSPQNFNSINKQIDEQFLALDQTTYRITVAGKSKAGKSTFINAFLKRKISPVDILPITGVPISFFPDKKDGVSIHFSNSKTVKNGPATDTFIEEFTSKEKNKGNTLGVKQINVSLVNEQLEQGVCFFDVPGLDDLEVSVKDFSWSTIGQSNAIIYLIDIAPYEYGSSFIDGEILRDLQRLISSNNIDKVFIVFNKVHAIKTKPIDRLKKHIELIFEEHGIAKYIHSKQFFIDSQESFEVRTGQKKKGRDYIKELEEELWKYLLAENKLGIYKFQKVITGLSTLTANYAATATLTIDKADRRGTLENEIAVVRATYPGLKTKLEVKKKTLVLSSDNYLSSRNTAIMSRLQNELTEDENKMSEVWIKQYLLDQTKITLKALNDYVGQQLLEQKLEMDEWVEENLNKIRNAVFDGGKKYSVDLTGLKEFKLSDIDDINVALGFLNFGLVLLLAIEFPPVAIIVGLLSLFGWATSKEDRRRRRIGKIVAKISEKYQKITNDVISKSRSRIAINIDNMRNYAFDRVTLFIDDIEKEIRGLDARKLDAATKTRIVKSLEEAKKLKTQIDQCEQALKYYY